MEVINHNIIIIIGKAKDMLLTKGTLSKQESYQKNYWVLLKFSLFLTSNTTNSPLEVIEGIIVKN